jgi:transcriptional regulator with XRE-family HTH domain
MAETYLQSILRRFREIRESKGIAPEAIEETLILGPGWISRFENGETIPSLDMLFAMLNIVESNLSELLEGLNAPEATELERHIFVVPDGDDLILHFKYANFDARYLLEDATSDEFDAVIKVLRDGLARLAVDAAESSEAGNAIKSDAVADAFLKAVSLWPDANPSDIWWFLIYRAYCDPFNHPAEFARLSFEQSWKRTGGWALEKVLVRHYAPTLAKEGIQIMTGTTEQKERLLRKVKDVDDRLEADKADVLLLGTDGNETHLFGIVHVKASFAERRTDDVPMSKALVDCH